MAEKEKNKSTKNNSVEKKNKKAVNSTKNKDAKAKQSCWVRFRIFGHGVKSETSKVHWPSKKDMVKYSIATILFIIFCSLFFYLIEIIFALIQSLIK